MPTGQRTNLKFLVRLVKSPSETLCMLQQVYQEQTLSRSTVFFWHKRFKEGHEDVEQIAILLYLSISKIRFSFKGTEYPCCS